MVPIISRSCKGRRAGVRFSDAEQSMRLAASENFPHGFREFFQLIRLLQKSVNGLFEWSAVDTRVAVPGRYDHAYVGINILDTIKRFLSPHLRHVHVEHNHIEPPAP